MHQLNPGAGEAERASAECRRSRAVSCVGIAGRILHQVDQQRLLAPVAAEIFHRTAGGAVTATPTASAGAEARGFDLSTPWR